MNIELFEAEFSDHKHNVKKINEDGWKIKRDVPKRKSLLQLVKHLTPKQVSTTPAPCCDSCC